MVCLKRSTFSAENALFEKYYSYGTVPQEEITTLGEEVACPWWRCRPGRFPILTFSFRGISEGGSCVGSVSRKNGDYMITTTGVCIVTPTKWATFRSEGCPVTPMAILVWRSNAGVITRGCYHFYKAQRTPTTRDISPRPGSAGMRGNRSPTMAYVIIRTPPPSEASAHNNRLDRRP